MDNDKKLYKITKLGPVDNPRDVNSAAGEGVHIGYYTGLPLVGGKFLLNPFSLKRGERGFVTSRITKIIDDKTFETLNSVYSYEPYNDGQR